MIIENENKLILIAIDLHFFKNLLKNQSYLMIYQWLRIRIVISKSIFNQSSDFLCLKISNTICWRVKTFITQVYLASRRQICLNKNPKKLPVNQSLKVLSVKESKFSKEFSTENCVFRPIFGHLSAQFSQQPYSLA